jgi:acyl carrier protein
MGHRLTDTDLARMRRQGLPALSTGEGLASFDAGLRAGPATVVGITIDPAALQARTDEVPALLRGLVRAPGRAAAQSGDASALRRRLAGLPVDRRTGALLDLVRTHAAALLGHDRPEKVEIDRGFLDLGFDSLAALELRGRLASATGLRLPPMLVFDYPTAAAVADHLHAELFGGEDTGAGRDLGSATAAELFEILDQELESSS